MGGNMPFSRLILFLSLLGIDATDLVEPQSQESAPIPQES